MLQVHAHPGYSSAALTHTGYVRPSNQDAFVERADAGLWAVADGMGGHRDGDVASAMVCKTLATLKPRSTLEATSLELQRRVNLVNARLYAAAVRPVNPVQSGTTLAALLVERTACMILWAGDSRVYRLRQGRLAQLTTDHTLAAQLAGRGGSHEYGEHAADHAITRAVGGDGRLRLELRQDEILPGDRLLLCSDGLTRELVDGRIAALLAQGDVHHCAQALLDATLAAGARDNVTVVVVAPAAAS